MATYKKKYKKNNLHSYYKSNRTGEDVDMLREREMESSSYKSASDSYKDHIDGA